MRGQRLNPVRVSFLTLVTSVALVIVIAAIGDSLGADASNVSDAAVARGNLGLESKAKCDGSTDDTATIAAELVIAYSSRRILQLPAGVCKVTGGKLVITQPVWFRGHGPGTELRIAAGSTGPAITITVTRYAVTPASVEISDMQIGSLSNADVPGQSLAHGIRLLQAATPVKTRVLLRNLDIHNVPGDCVHAGSGEFTASGGWVVAYSTDCRLPGGDGISANTANDWRWYGGDFSLAVRNNMVFSSVGNFVLNGVNSYGAGQYDIHLFNSGDIHLIGGESGAAKKDGIFVDNRTGGTLFITDYPNIGNNSESADQAYSDITLSAANTGNVYITNSYFMNPAAINPGSKYNIEFKAGNSGLVFTKNNKFAAGNWLSPRVMNTPAQYAGDEPPVAWPSLPTFVGSTGGTAAMTVQVGSISINHGVAHIQGAVQAKGSLAGLRGALRISGLPVGPVATANDSGLCSIIATGWTAPANFSNITGLIGSRFGTTSILLHRTATNGSAATETAMSEWAANSSVKFSCDYKYIENQ